MNTTRAHRPLTIAMALYSMTGCSNTDTNGGMPLNPDHKDRYSSGPNKLFVNGRHPTVKQINGMLLNGRQISGRKVNGSFEANGANNELISLVFTDAADGTVYKGAGLVGIEVSGQTSDGAIRDLRFAAHDPTTVPGTNLYLVKYIDSGESVCGNLDGQPIWAAILPQLFNETTGGELGHRPASP